MSDTNKIKAYIIMNRSLIYNDSTYDVQEGGEPRVAFLNKKEADNKCKEFNINSLKEFGDLTNLTNDLKYLDKDGCLFQKIVKYGGTIDTSYKEPFVTEFQCSMLTDEQTIDILDSLDFDFNYVQAIELE